MLNKYESIKMKHTGIQKEQRYLEIAILGEGQVIAEEFLVKGMVIPYDAYCNSSVCEVYCMEASKIVKRLSSNRQIRKEYGSLRASLEDQHLSRKKHNQNLFDANSAIETLDLTERLKINRNPKTATASPSKKRQPSAELNSGQPEADLTASSTQIPTAL